MFDGRISSAPHVHRTRAVLDARGMLRNCIKVFEGYRARLGSTFTVHFGGLVPALVTADPVVIKHVLRSNEDNYEKSFIQAERMVEFQGAGVVNIHGEAWKRQRKLLAQGFKPNYLAKLLPMQQDVFEELMHDFDGEARRGPVNIRQQMVQFTLRLTGKALYGRSMPTAELERIGAIIHEIQNFVHRQIVQPWMIPWYRINGQSAKYQQLRREGDAIALRHIRARLSEGLGDNDFLRILTETPYHDTGLPMDEPMVMLESLQLLVAGNVTSTNALAWIFYLLARHPKYILEIRDEVASVIGANAMDYHNLHRLEGTVRVIDEALRLYPPFWMIDRIALSDDAVNGIHIPARAMVIPYIYGTHRNPAHWQNVEAFDPGRFESRESRDRHPFAYIPFGGGPRTCLGTNMAVMQMLMIVAAFVRKYDFALVTNEPIDIDPSMMLRPKGVVSMQFRAVA
jgi:cytochrome P450